MRRRTAYPREMYRSLGWRTIFATIAVALAVVTAFGSDLVSLAFAGDESDGALLAIGAGGLAQFGAVVVSVTAVCMWMHCAATNLRAFGNPYLNFTPAGSVGWWFVPFANFVKPFQAMREIVNASDPSTLTVDGILGSMPAPSPAGMLSLWWGAWIGSNLIANVSSRIDDPVLSGSVSLVSSMLWAVAGVLLVLLMRRVEAHQAECDRRLRREPMPAPAPYPYRAPGAF